jgi:hypothetical protein
LYFHAKLGEAVVEKATVFVSCIVKHFTRLPAATGVPLPTATLAIF